MRSNASAGQHTITLKEAPMLTDHNASPSGNAVLPPVQIGSNQNSFTAKGQPPNLSNILSVSSGRRKSTPAALDMVLRSAEGKAAVEQLLQPQGQNKLVFGNYFAGTSAAARDQAVAMAAAEKRKAAAAASAGSPPGASPHVPRPPPGQPPSAAAHKPQQLPALQLHDSMATVPEDVVMDDVGKPQAAPSSARKHPYDSVSSVQGYPPTSPAAHKLHQPAPPVAPPAPAHQAQGYQPHTPSSSQPQQPQSPLTQAMSSPHPSGSPARPPPVPQPQQQQQLPAAPSPQQAPAPAEEPTTSSRPNSKLVSLSPQIPAAMQRKYWTLADYNIIRKMYTGYASTVYQAMCKKSLEMVALKVYHMQNLCELNHYQVFREIRVHSSLQHQNIIHLFAAFQEGTDVVLVQEYAEGGDLYRLLHKNGGRLSERQAVEMVLHPFLLALHYLHTRGIMHRDIKPENVLFTEHRVLKLADFGLAIDLTEERAVTRAGTLDYMAPEVLRCPPKNLPQENKNNPYLHYNNSVDAWAVGVFAYELIVGFPPFAGETQLDSVDRIMHSVPEFPAKISEFAKDFICQCLRKHPGDRPTVMELLHHPWVRTFQRRTSMRITAVPRRRSSVVYNPGSLAHPPGAAHEAYTPPQEAAEEGYDAGPAPMETDMADMTPEDIERMITKLQVAKAQAIAKSESHRGPGQEVLMQQVRPMQI
ncbi:hypothetical protein HYH03_011789 [Edaphochlamys debaryana]|uniref:Protein kinase domain-containing protein n=1 Tax=Edaphochlamys debaryana TaxID=47281 RepID=A0A835XZC9_9CHLO|nr:hypothetical protein HYH03_011789 [Edaphochlamys debaryana]|eukprot:KAG2489680.1 hypothetical protein HYH03_011789 [Edaphochlamys debaryana]